MDREKVIKGLETCSQKTVLYVCGSCPYNNDDDNTYDCTQALSEDALTLLKDQEEKTGKWIEKTDYMGDTYYDCSVCNESWITIEGTPWVNGMNYCPHCGAKMEFEGR